ncbi:MAG: c-type cytochrome [Nitrospirae bacterium]|nr:c-type cytochrome [Nitrospirota bacterium]
MELDEGLDDLTRQLTKGLSSRYSMTVGVVDFRGLNGEVTALGRYIAEEMITRLFIREGVRVIERAQLERALEELKFSQTDLFDPALAKKLGKFVGADAILSGTLTSLDSTVRVNARLFSTERAEILAVGTASIVRDDRVNRLLKILLQPQSLSDIEVPAKGITDEQEYSGRKDYTDRPVTIPPVFESDYLRVTVKSFKRSGSRLIVELWYENLTDLTIRLVSSDWGRAYATSHRGTYLLSDTGERWLFEDDTQVGNHYGGTELISRRRLLNQITFSPEDRGNGSEFTYVGKYSIRWRSNPREAYRHETVEVIIRNIQPGEYDVGYQDEAVTSPESSEYTPFDSAVTGDWNRGERIFRKNCVVCHGQRGDGKGPASTLLNPRPKDFRRSTIDRGQMAEVIRSGIRGTSMVGFGKTLVDKDIQDVVEYVYRFRDR